MKIRHQPICNKILDDWMEWKMLFTFIVSYLTPFLIYWSLGRLICLSAAAQPLCFADVYNVLLVTLLFASWQTQLQGPATVVFFCQICRFIKNKGVAFVVCWFWFSFLNFSIFDIGLRISVCFGIVERVVGLNVLSIITPFLIFSWVIVHRNLLANKIIFDESRSER